MVLLTSLLATLFTGIALCIVVPYLYVRIHAALAGARFDKALAKAARDRKLDD